MSQSQRDLFYNLIQYLKTVRDNSGDGITTPQRTMLQKWIDQAEKENGRLEEQIAMESSKPVEAATPDPGALTMPENLG